MSREVVLKGVGPSAEKKEVHTDSGGSPWVQLRPVARVATSAIQKKQCFKSPALGLLSSIKGLFLYQNLARKSSRKCGGAAQGPLLYRKQTGEAPSAFA